jgi:hypothetical protein
VPLTTGAETSDGAATRLNSRRVPAIYAGSAQFTARSALRPDAFVLTASFALAWRLHDLACELDETFSSPAVPITTRR